MLLYPILSIALAISFMPFGLRLARRYGLYDYPDARRKVHDGNIPITGGYGIIIAFTFTVAAMWTVEGWRFFANAYHNLVPMYLYIFEATAIIVILGIIDDLRELTYSQKFFFQFIAAFLMILGAIRSDILPQVFSAQQASVIVSSGGMVLSLLWLVGTTNAINMIDGMDGLAGGTSLISALALAGVAFLWGNTVIALVLLVLGGAILGFLLFNVHPARVFMGDGGSMFIGFVLAVCGWLLVDSGPDTLTSMLVPVIILGLPVSDTLLAFFRRIIQGSNPFSADLFHIHHMVKQRFDLSLRGTVLVLWAVTMLYGIVGVVVATSSSTVGWVLFALLILGKMAFLHVVGYTAHVRRQPVELRPLNGNGVKLNGLNGNGNGHHNGNGHSKKSAPARRKAG